MAMAKASWAVLKDQPTLGGAVISAVAAVLLSLLLLIPAVLGFVTAAGLGASDKGFRKRWASWRSSPGTSGVCTSR